jgi:hypothetical protein
LRGAMKGFGTDEKTLIRVLATKDPLQINTIRDAYTRIHRRSLEADIKSETRGWFEEGLVALVRGPLLHDVHMLHMAMSGPGTKEKVLNDVLLGRSNADMNAIKSEYHKTFRRKLEDAVKGDLTLKTERHFMIVLQAQRAEDSAPVVKAEIDRDVSDLYAATEGKVGTDEMRVCSILSTRNDNQIRAIAQEYRAKYARNLEDVIRKVRLPLIAHVPPLDFTRLKLTSFCRSSLVTWRKPFSSSSAMVWTSTCTRPSSSRTPWQVLEPRTIFWSAAWSDRTGTVKTWRTSKEPTNSATNGAWPAESRERPAVTTRG